MSKLEGMIWGALASTLLTSTYALIGSRPDLVKKFKNQTQDLAGKARNVRDNIYEELQVLSETRRSRGRKTFFSGAVIGLLIGAGTAAFFTTKAGKQMRRDLNRKYHGMSKKTHDVVEFINQNGYRKPLNKIARRLAGINFAKKSKIAKRKHAIRSRH